MKPKPINFLTLIFILISYGCFTKENKNGNIEETASIDTLKQNSSVETKEPNEYELEIRSEKKYLEDKQENPTFELDHSCCLDTFCLENLMRSIKQGENQVLDSVYKSCFPNNLEKLELCVLPSNKDSNKYILDEMDLGDLFENNPDIVAVYGSDILNNYNIDIAFEFLLACYLCKVNRCDWLNKLSGELPKLDSNTKVLIINQARYDDCDIPGY